MPAAAPAQILGHILWPDPPYRVTQNPGELYTIWPISENIGLFATSYNEQF